MMRFEMFCEFSTFIQMTQIFFIKKDYNVELL